MMPKLVKLPPPSLPPPTYDLQGLSQTHVEKLCALLCAYKDEDMDDLLEALSGISSTKYRTWIRAEDCKVSVNELELRPWP